jgi:mannose-1-phosphate guanylyltransferase
MRDEPLLVTNGDIYHTVDYLDFYQHHIKNEPAVTLAMRDHHRFNTVMIRDGRVASFDNRVEFTQLAFTGLHVIEPRILEEIERNKMSCIIDLYRKLLDRGEEIGCFRVDDCFWTDMGTVEDYLDLHRGLLMDDIPCWPEIGDVRKPYCIDKAAKLPAHIVFEDWVCIGGAHIEDGSHLERVVVWDDARIAAGSHLVDTIVSNGSEV